jgi:hypothetical protein
MDDRRSPEVDEWLDANEGDSADAMRLSRQIILESDQRVAETIKWSTPTFVYKGNIISFTPTKKGVGLMFHRGAEIPGDHPLMIGDGRLVRTMRFADPTEVEVARGDIRNAIVAWCDWRDANS